MNISGGPEELATFIRCVNGEPTTWLDAEPEPAPAPRPARPLPPPPKGLHPAWLASAMVFVLALFLLQAYS